MSDPADLRAAWEATSRANAHEAAQLRRPEPAPEQCGGRMGATRNNSLSCLAEMQVLPRDLPRRQVVMRSADDWLALLARGPGPGDPCAQYCRNGHRAQRGCARRMGFAVNITPTYMGCPAMDAIADDIRRSTDPIGSGGRPKTPSGTGVRPCLDHGLAFGWRQSQARSLWHCASGQDRRQSVL